MLKKSIILIIALMVIGLAVVSAQAVPLPPLPNMTLTMPPRRSGEAYKVDVTSATLQRWLEVKDQRNYAKYLLNSGYITQDEYRGRDRPLEQDEADIILPIAQADQAAYIMAQGAVERALKMLWDSGWPPGWPARQMSECIGFNLQQPTGTRVISGIERGLIRPLLVPYSDQAFNNLKQQLEGGFGATLTYNSDFDRYEYVLRSNRSPNGRTYRIWLTRRINDYIDPSGNSDRNRPSRIYLEVAEMTRDP